MRILTFNYEYPPLGGGGGVIHQQIVEELARRHEVVVITSGWGDLPPRETIRGVDIHRVRVLGRRSLAAASLVSMLSYYPASLKKGQEIIGEFRPDVINSHFAIPTGPSAIKLARRNRIPHALCIHGGDIYDPSKLLSPHRVPGLRQTVRRVLRNSDVVLAQSENTAQNARKYYGYSGDITIIPHGLKRPNFAPVNRSELGLRDDQIVLINVGRLVARKANHQLIEMLAELADDRVVLVFVGEGPERERLEALAQTLGVAHRVLMPGYVSEERKLQLLYAADIFSSTSSHEGFGLMFVEAMFCTKPIISYDHGGQSDFLRDGSTGFLVPLDDRLAFQESLKRLIQDKNLRETMGSYNSKLASNFTIEHCAAQYETVFCEMASLNQEQKRRDNRRVENNSQIGIRGQDEKRSRSS